MAKGLLLKILNPTYQFQKFILYNFHRKQFQIEGGGLVQGVNEGFKKHWICDHDNSWQGRGGGGGGGVGGGVGGGGDGGASADGDHTLLGLS